MKVWINGRDGFSLSEVRNVGGLVTEKREEGHVYSIGHTFHMRKERQLEREGGGASKGFTTHTDMSSVLFPNLVGGLLFLICVCVVGEAGRGSQELSPQFHQGKHSQRLRRSGGSPLGLWRSQVSP